MKFGGDQARRDGYVAGTTVSENVAGASQVLVSKFENGDMHCTIENDDEDKYDCFPYKLSKFRLVILFFLYLCTAGFLWLVFYWRPDWKLKFTHYGSNFHEKYDSVYLKQNDGTERVYVASVKMMDKDLKIGASYLFADDIGWIPNRQFEDSGCSKETVPYFVHQYRKYVWHESNQTFLRIEGFDDNTDLKHIMDAYNTGITERKQAEILKLFGENIVRVEVPSYFRLLVSEILNPFYIFQLFACIFWMVDEYVTYATAILVISLISAIITLISIRKERQRLHDMVEHHNTCRVKVVREVSPNDANEDNALGDDISRRTEEIWSKDLVPGDIIIIPPSGIHMSFDAVVMSGTCIVDESMLTGESIPVTKTSLTVSSSEMKKKFNVTAERSHTLFCGTNVIQTRYYPGQQVMAVVVRTGFDTAKGMLVHSILFPKPVNLKLMRDAYRFMFVMFAIALIGFCYSVYIKTMNGESTGEIFLRSIDLITITVPPALPLAMSIGIIYAQKRLKNVHISTISPQRINIAGLTDIVAFDKTGTLTKDGLDLTELLPVTGDGSNFAATLDLNLLDHSSAFVHCMTTCHSLTLVEDQLMGDPLDVKMFEATGWKLVEPKIEDESKFDQLQTTYVQPPSSVIEELTNSQMLSSSSDNSTSGHELGIIRQFPFASTLQRAGVLVKPLQSGPKDLIAYFKGAPEVIADLCTSVPSSFDYVLRSYTEKGYRVIGLSYKPMNMAWLKAQKVEREIIERDLIFLGLVVLKNQLKDNSTEVVRDLRDAGLRTVMVTGDNPLTATCVARDCGLLKNNIPVLIANVECANYSVGAGDCGPLNIALTWIPEIPQNDKSRISPLSSSSDCSNTTIITVDDNYPPHDCQLVMTGREFALIQKHFREYIPAIAVQGTVFARMSPQQKTELMEILDDVDYHVLMCGDGANDCGALKRAHVGLSLSEHDASVAAPFTAHGENGVESVITLIREGRAAIVTSYGMFKFMALYSLIQFTTVILLYNSDSNLSDYQFLYTDLIVIDVVAITMSRNHAHKYLDSRKPSRSLVSVEMLVSLILQILLQMGIQILAYLLVRQQCWYTETILTQSEPSGESHNVTESPVYQSTTAANTSWCPLLADVPTETFTEDDYARTYETATLFYLCSFMYLAVGVAFSRGRPFRTPFYKNKLFVIGILILTASTLAMTFIPSQEMAAFMEWRMIPDKTFLAIIVVIALGHLLASLFIEMVLIENDTLCRGVKNLTEKTQSQKYKAIQKFLLGEINDQTLGDQKVAIPALVARQSRLQSRVARF